MGLRVILEKGSEVVLDRIFNQGVVSVGRESVSDVMISDAHISMQHLVIRQAPEGWCRIFDLSSNGTYYEGKRIDALRFDRPMTVEFCGYSITLIPSASRIGTGTEPSGDVLSETVMKPLGIEEEVLPATVEREHPESGDRAAAELRVTSSLGETQSLVFRDRATIGRSADCDLRFTALAVSRLHCEIVPGDAGYLIRRVSEKSSCVVNNKVLSVGASMQLRDGDVIRVGDEEIVFLYPARHLDTVDDMTKALPVDFSPIAIVRRGCSDPQVVAFDVVGELNGNAGTIFEEEMRKHLQNSSSILLDFEHLHHVDADGAAALARVISAANEQNIEIQMIRITPRIADVLSYSALKQILRRHVSSTEDTAIKRLRLA